MKNPEDREAVAAIDLNPEDLPRESLVGLVKLYSRLLIGVEGRDVVSFMKVIQATPLHYVVEETMEVQTRNRATITVTYCPTLAALEKEDAGEKHPALQNGILGYADQACQAVQSGDRGRMPDHAAEAGQARRLLPLGVQYRLKRTNRPVVKGCPCPAPSLTEIAVVA